MIDIKIIYSMDKYRRFKNYTVQCPMLKTNPKIIVNTLDNGNLLYITKGCYGMIYA